MSPMRLVVLGLSLSSSWGNGHATTYRALLRAFAQRGHDIVFLERNQPWYAENRDLSEPEYCTLTFYDDLGDLASHRGLIADADAVIVGSYVPDGVAVGRMVQAHARGITVFYDIDTPVTLAMLEAGDCPYLSPDLIAAYDLYLSFTGGPTLARLMDHYGAGSAQPLYCSVDDEHYRPLDMPRPFDLGYLGTYSPDRQPTLERLLIEPARLAPERRFIVAGAQYPEGIAWPPNVERLDHVPPADHPALYGSCRWMLNVTRADMIRAGHSPSVRLFESAACGTPIISDIWAGIDELFTPDREIILAVTATDILATLAAGPALREAVAQAARRKVLGAHTASHRARELEEALRSAAVKGAAARPGTVAPSTRLQTTQGAKG